MASGFELVTHALRRDSGGRSGVLLVGACTLLGAWLSWAFEARITRYELSDSARLEVNASAYPVQANLSGRLVNSALVLGREVNVGEVLAELDSDEQQLSLAEERTRLAGLAPQIAALRSQISTETTTVSEERRVNTFAAAAAQAQYNEAQTQARLAAAEADRANRLHAEGILSDADNQRAQAETQTKHAAAESLRVAISRLEPEQQVRERDRDLHRKQMEADIARLEAEAASSNASARRLEGEVLRRRVLAPVTGRLAECAAIRLGAHVSEGQQLGVILPSGNLQVVAEFAPAAALGKVRPGQRAAVRLDGFPWAQYGTVPARVARVADEIRGGTVHVELAVLAASRRIPYQHGLPGSVEVEVERISPAALVLRSAGQMVGAR